MCDQHSLANAVMWPSPAVRGHLHYLGEGGTGGEWQSQSHLTKGVGVKSHYSEGKRMGNSNTNGRVFIISHHDGLSFP